MTSGYSETPLAKKLSLNDGTRLWADCMPASVAKEIRSGAAVTLAKAPKPPVDAAHLFVTRRDVLDCKLRLLLPLLHSKGFIWVSWPKKASKQPTDITEDVIRDIALPMGLVDVKVCAVDDTWSALKLVIRQQKGDVR